MKINNVERQLVSYARVIAGAIGVRVKFGGHQAYCGLSPTNETRRIINLPGLPLDNPELTEAMWGYLYHEGFHAKYSDFNLIKEIHGQGLAQHLTHLIEDIWNENHCPNEWLSSKRFIDAMNNYMLGQNMYQVPTKDMHPSSFLTSYILYWGLGYHNNTPALQPLADQCQALLADVLSAGGMVKLQAILSTYVPQISCSRDSYKVAQMVVDLIEEEEQQTNQDLQQKQQQPDTSDASGKSDDQSQAQGSDSDSGDDNSSTAGSGADDNQPSDDNTTDDGIGSGDASSDAGNDTNDGNGAPSDSPSSASSDAGQPQQSSQGPGHGSQEMQDRLDALQQMLNAQGNDLKHHLDQLVEQLQQQSQCSDELAMTCAQLTYDEASSEQDSSVDVRELYDNARAASHGVRRAMRRLFESTDRKDLLSDNGYSINQNVMHTALSGNTKIFQNRRIQKAPNTAIHLLMDNSGSMGRIIKEALMSIMAIANALEGQKGVKFAATRFPANNPNEYGWSVASLIDYDKRVGESLRNFAVRQYGSTPLAEAMMFAIQELGYRKETRKILFCVTDGDPNCCYSVKNAIEYAGKFGIEIMAVGIGSGCQNLPRLIDNHVIIDNVSELSNAVLTLVTQAMIRHRAA